MIVPQDDLLHRGSADPYWNESAWFGFTVPERSLTGWVYCYHRPNMNFSVGGVALWDPSGEHAWDCLYYDWGTPVPLSPDTEMFDFSLESGLTIRCHEPLTSFSLDFRGADCVVDLSWTSLAPPQSAVRGGARELPSGADQWATGHYNQPGSVRGSVELRGETIPVDCLYLRDHSWGPRRFTNPRGDFASVVASADSGFCVLAASDRPAASDPGVGVADPVAFGWYLKDGEISRLVTGRRTVLERDARGRPVAVSVEGRDESGRELTATGRCRNVLHWNGYPSLHMFWSMVDWEFDGRSAVGEEQDYFPIQQVRRLLRGS
jgi:hypothetical protein